jgi:hypothetical protein
VRKALVLTGVAGLAGLLVLTGCGKKVADNASSATTSSATTTTPAAADPSTLGPDGYAGINLGATPAEVKAAGYKVEDTDTPCSGSAEIKGPKGYASVLISAKDGVYLISARDPEPTPEGIKIGSTLAEVKQAYPAMTDVVGNPAKDDDTTRLAPTHGANPKAQYNIIMKDGKVDALALRLLDCTG